MNLENHTQTTTPGAKVDQPLLENPTLICISNYLKNGTQFKAEQLQQVGRYLSHVAKNYLAEANQEEQLKLPNSVANLGLKEQTPRTLGNIAKRLPGAMTKIETGQNPMSSFAGSDGEGEIQIPSKNQNSEVTSKLVQYNTLPPDKNYILAENKNPASDLFRWLMAIFPNGDQLDPNATGSEQLQEGLESMFTEAYEMYGVEATDLIFSINGFGCGSIEDLHLQFLLLKPVLQESQEGQSNNLELVLNPVYQQALQEDMDAGLTTIKQLNQSQTVNTSAIWACKKDEGTKFQIVTAVQAEVAKMVKIEEFAEFGFSANLESEQLMKLILKMLAPGFAEVMCRLQVQVPGQNNPTELLPVNIKVDALGIALKVWEEIYRNDSSATELLKTLRNKLQDPDKCLEFIELIYTHSFAPYTSDS